MSTFEHSSRFSSMYFASDKCPLHDGRRLRSKIRAEFARVDKEFEWVRKNAALARCDTMRVSTSVRRRTQAFAQMVNKV